MHPFHNLNSCRQRAAMTPATTSAQKCVLKPNIFTGWVEKSESRGEKLDWGKSKEQRGREGGREEWVRTNHRRREREGKHSFFPTSDSQNTELEMLEAAECLLSYKHWVKPAGRKKLLYAKENQVSQSGKSWAKRRESHSVHIWAHFHTQRNPCCIKLSSAPSLWIFHILTPKHAELWSLSTLWWDLLIRLSFFPFEDRWKPLVFWWGGWGGFGFNLASWI